MLPSHFFSNKDEGTYADELWARAPNHPVDAITLGQMTKLPLVEQRLVKAGLMSIDNRWAPDLYFFPSAKRAGPGGRANVEHFWISAMLRAIQPANPVGGLSTHALNTLWDGFISPGGKLLKQDWGHDPWGSVKKAAQGWMHDMEQLYGPDMNGIKFAEFYMNQQSRERAQRAVQFVMKKAGLRR
jgi:hypothetical protein